LVDSPALNANSRAVLVPLARPQLPTTAVVVAGPGPIEPHARDQLTDASPDAPKLEPNVPSQRINLPGDDSSPTTEGHSSARDGLRDEDAEAGVDGDDDDDDIDGNPVADPYANLDGAFGGYLADQPQPIVGRQRGGNDLDDLLV
jgi:AP-2 complex subunit beta-1